MKTLLAIAALCFAISANALTVNVQFTQNEWFYSLNIFVPTLEAPEGGQLSINGIDIGAPAATGLSLANQIFPESGPVPPLQYGVNTVSFLYHGVSYSGDSFTISVPTVPYPTNLPDAGATVALLALALGLLWRVHGVQILNSNS